MSQNTQPKTNPYSAASPSFDAEPSRQNAPKEERPRSDATGTAERQASVNYTYTDIDISRPPRITIPRPHGDGGQDALNTEFMYYSALLKSLAPALSHESDKQDIIPWIRKLFAPEYHSSMFKEKRNRYLLSLILTLLNDEVFGIFVKRPPVGALPDLSTMKRKFPLANWQRDLMWEDSLKQLSPAEKTPGCSVHERGNGFCEEESDEIFSLMDQEFKFFLYLARPYAALLPSAEDRTKIGSWIQKLCAISGNACAVMKGIRNDYMKALLGYISTLNVAGPFVDYPPEPPLPSLQIAAKRHARSHPFTDPTSRETDEFLRSQPIPENGAFLYVAVSGELADRSIYQKTGKPGEDLYIDEAADESKIEHIITTQLNRLPHMLVRGATEESLNASGHLTSFGAYE